MGSPSLRILGLLTLGLMMAVPAQGYAANGEPPTGRGLMISGGIVGAAGVAILVPGVVYLITGASSREGLGTFIGATLTGIGLAFVGVGTGLLVPGVIRHRRHRAWEAEHVAAGTGGLDRFGAAPGGFVIRF